MLLLKLLLICLMSYSCTSFQPFNDNVRTNSLPKLHSMVPITIENLRYFAAGGIAASFSHGITVPIDVIKTKIQTDPLVYTKDLGVYGAAVKLVQKEGFPILLQGLGPTLLGYSIQGSLKYGFYEIFKPMLLAEYPFFEGNKLLLFIVAGAMAELIGSSTLTPFEAARIRLVVNPSFASGVQGNSLLLFIRMHSS
jgi:solute carrier family 25 (mitochondrial phosphate transporter), member 3